MTGQPVHDLQEMLQFLSYTCPDMPQIIADGNFGERTLEAVMVFQRDHGLPVTGTVDSETWYAISSEYRKAFRQIGAPAPLRVLRDGKDTVPWDGNLPPVSVIEAMFDSLSVSLTNFRARRQDGNRSFMVENTAELRRVCGLSKSGAMDRAAWDGLARLYALFVTRRAGGWAEPPAGE